jgi:hypothetical protein
MGNGELPTFGEAGMGNGGESDCDQERGRNGGFAWSPESGSQVGAMLFVVPVSGPALCVCRRRCLVCSGNVVTVLYQVVKGDVIKAASIARLASSTEIQKMISQVGARTSLVVLSFIFQPPCDHAAHSPSARSPVVR